MTNSVDGTSARTVDREEEDDDTIELELSDSAIRWLAEAASEAQPDLGPALEASELGTEILNPESPASDEGTGVVGPGAPAGNYGASAVSPGAPAGNRGTSAVDPESPTAMQGKAPVVSARSKSWPRFALVLGIALGAAGLLGGLAYLAKAPARPPVIAAAESVSRPTAAPEVSTPAPSPTSDTPVRFKNPFDASEVFEFPPGTSDAEARAAVAELLSQRALERQSELMKRPRRNSKTADRNTSVSDSHTAPRG